MFAANKFGIYLKVIKKVREIGVIEECGGG